MFNAMKISNEFWNTLGSYVYGYKNVDGSYKYIGKGTGARCTEHLKSKGYFGADCEIIARNLEKFDDSKDASAFLLESFMIKHNNLVGAGDNAVNGHNHLCFENVGMLSDMYDKFTGNTDDMAFREINYILNETVIAKVMPFIESQRAYFSHKQFTPWTLVADMLDKLNLKKPNDKKVLAMYSVEYIAELIKRGFNRDNLTVWTEEYCPVTRDVCEKLLDVTYLTGELTMKFDVIVGNPPYQHQGNQTDKRDGAGGRAWDSFARIAIDQTVDNGKLALIHPPTWRSVRSNSSLWPMLTEFQMDYLSMHSKKEGVETFGAQTAYDWYVVTKTPYYKETTVKDYKNEVKDIDFRDKSFLTNWGFELSNDLFSKELVSELLVCQAFDKPKYKSSEITETHTVPLALSVTKDGPRISYGEESKREKSHFGVGKVIVSSVENCNHYNDAVGYFGINGPDTLGVPVSSIKHGEVVCDFLKSRVWKEFHMSINFTNYKLDRKLFSYIDWSEENLKGIMAKHG